MTLSIDDSFGSWRFVHDLADGADDQFDAILDLFDAGDLDGAEEMLRRLLLVCPDHIDALHHLAMIFDETGRSLEAYLCTREAVRIGLAAMPSNFSWLTGRLSWLELPNRPFLRAYHSLALHLLRLDLKVEALEILARLVSVDARDSLGARYLLMKCFLDTSNWHSAVALAQQYPDDVGPDIAYSRVIAYLQLDDRENAIKFLETAIRYKPNVAKELLKARHVRPKAMHAGYVVSGGDDEAFDYWEHNGVHWTRGSDAFELLSELSKRRSGPGPAGNQ